ncbi:MAG: ABC transporter ATP-binding protein [Candidatus Brocadiaceae bacterium]|jgi:ABC-2 type transport system ATP-binding protein
MSTVIEARDLTRRFGHLVAVDHVGFEVKEGEVFGFLGPNGAGKTTTVRMLTGVIDPTEGTATIRGHDIREEPLAAREHLGIVPEEANVYLDLSVWRNVMLMAELHAVPRAQRVRAGEGLLGQLGLSDRRKQKARTLSKGLRQRLMLCSALVSEPEILFLDEPTSGLDVQSARLIRGIVSEMNRGGLTVFLTTHNMSEAEQMCDRVAIISHGNIVAIDTPAQLRNAMESSQYVTVSFEDGGPSEDQLKDLPGVDRLSVGEDGFRLSTQHPGRVVTEVVKLAERSGCAIGEVATCKPTLEDVFVQLTGGVAKEGQQ